MPNRKKNKTKLTHAIELTLIVMAAILIRSLIFELWVVPSSSMLPNLLVGDRIIVQKYSYGISNHSFPLSPTLFKGRKFVFEQPQRGDIVVFETDKVYVKRLIGLPGDKIQMLDGTLYINDVKVPKLLTYPFDDNGQLKPQYVEILPNNIHHSVLDTLTTGRFDNTGIYVVPESHYFFMGDNRDDSRDSRDSRGPIGFVHEDKLLGRVRAVLFSSKDITWYNIPNVILKMRFDRFLYPLVN